MSTIDQAFNACIELGKILSETDEYKKIKEAEGALLHDEKARAKMEELQQLQMHYRQMQMNGYKLAEEDIKKLDGLEKDALSNPIVKKSYEANMNFQDLMKTISAKIREGIRMNSQN